MSFAAAIEEASKAALCGWLANGGNAAVATWIVNGSRTPMTAIAGAAAGLGLLALNYGCNYDPDAATGASDFVNGQCSGWDAYLLRQDGYPSYGAWATKFDADTWDWVGWNANGKPEFRNKTTGALFQASDYSLAKNAEVAYGDGATKTACTEGPTGSPEPYQPYTYVDATTNCSYVVEHESYVFDDTGTVTPVLKISKGAGTRASGGIIGGCNFNPVIVIPPGGGGGGGGTYPWNPGPDGPGGTPWWWPIAQTALGNLIGGLIKDLLTDSEGATARKVAELLVGSDSGMLPAVTYDLLEPCDPEGTGARQHEVPIPGAPALTAIAARCDALEIFQQYQKDYRQPTCSLKTPRSGDPVTVRFVSDEPSTAGERPLQKTLTYLDQTASLLDVHTDHWKDFSWQAGPVCVISKGLSWGEPQVWASTAEEGKRVIAHAAQVAGVDLTDPKHSWLVTGSSSPRVGQAGTMRVQWRSGLICVSKRSGPSGLPVLAGPAHP